MNTKSNFDKERSFMAVQTAEETLSCFLFVKALVKMCLMCATKIWM